MTITYTTPNPHGRARDLLIDAMLRAMEEHGETLPESRPADTVEDEGQPEG